MRFLFQFLCAFLTACSVMTPAQTVSVDVESPEALLQKLETFSCEEVSDFIRKRRPDPEKSADVSQQHARRVLEVYLTLSRCALNERSRAEIFEGQLRGMVAALGDPHSRYYNEKEYAELLQEFDGRRTGVIGVLLEKEVSGPWTGMVRVTRVTRDSPAERAGLEVNDIIVAVEGRSAVPLKDADEVAKLIRGELGTTVRLDIVKGGIIGAATRAIVVTRDEIKEVFVRAELLPSKWLHMIVSGFSGTMTLTSGGRKHSLCVDMERLYREALQREPNIEGMILDLRDNGGGQLRGAQCVFDLLAPERIDGKVLVTQRKRNGIQPPSIYIDSQDLLQGKPLLVLVDEGTASASEIVAKGVQYYGFGIVAGSLTYGKGSVQEIEALYDGKTGMKYTISEYLIGMPDAPAPVQGVGVTPDILLKEARPFGGAPYTPVRERDLPGAFAGTNVVKDIVPRQVEKEQSILYRRILEILAQKPFELVPEK